MRLYRGNDRRLLNKAKKVLALILARDTTARSPRRTSKISNRVEMFPVASTLLFAQLGAVTAQIQTKLDATV